MLRKQLQDCEPVRLHLIDCEDRNRGPAHCQRVVEVFGRLCLDVITAELICNLAQHLK